MSDTLAKGIISMLNANTTIANRTAGRIYNFRIPQESDRELPAIAFEIGLPIPYDFLADDNFADTVAWTIPLSIFVITQDPDQLIGLSSAVRDVFHLWTGTISETPIDRIKLDSYSSDWVENPESFYSRIDFTIYSQGKPTFTT